MRRRAALVAAFIVYTECLSFGWGIFDIPFPNTRSSAAVRGESAADEFPFLPQLKGKPFFDAVNDMSICRDPEVQKFLYAYLSYGRRYTAASIQRSAIYRDIVDGVIAETPDIPKDIALLPLLESGYNPFAVSRSRAVGLWQFLGGTAKMLNMRMDGWQDQRRDIEMSTRAAMRHLRSLYGIFGSWELTLAAYNGGAGYVKRAMIRTGKTTYSELRECGVLRRETSEYVARYAALMVIYKNRELFGVNGECEAESLRDTEWFVLDRPVVVRHFAEIAGVPLETIRRLNPALSGAITPPYEKNYRLRVPSAAMPALAAGKDVLYSMKFTSVKNHTVRRGESIVKIARLYNTTPRMILLVNDIPNPKRLRPGQKLYIPICRTSVIPPRRAPT